MHSKDEELEVQSDKPAKYIMDETSKGQIKLKSARFGEVDGHANPTFSIGTD